MPFPCFKDQIDRHGLSFLAICSIRRLLNRIHRAMYAAYPGSSTSELSPPGMVARSTSTLQPNGILTVGSLGSICAELNRQLDAWYNSLPDGIKPDLTQDDPQNLQEGWIRSRYWSAKHIICRPCLVYAASVSDPLHLPSYVLKYSEMCVESCRKYIKTASYILMRRTQYTWMTIQALVNYPSGLTNRPGYHGGLLMVTS